MIQKNGDKIKSKLNFVAETWKIFMTSYIKNLP